MKVSIVLGGAPMILGGKTPVSSLGLLGGLGVLSYAAIGDKGFWREIGDVLIVGALSN